MAAEPTNIILGQSLFSIRKITNTKRKKKRLCNEFFVQSSVRPARKTSNTMLIIRRDRKIRESKRKVENNGNWLRNVRGSIRELPMLFGPFNGIPRYTFNTIVFDKVYLFRICSSIYLSIYNVVCPLRMALFL